MYMQPSITPDDDPGMGGGGGGAAPANDDEHNNPGNPPTTDTPPKADPPKADPERSPIVTRERFDAVNTKYRELQDTHTALSASFQSTVSERDALKSEATTAKEHAAQLETVMTGILNARLEALPEDKRDLIPESLPVDQKLVWLEKAMAKGIFGTTPQIPIGTPTNPPPGSAAMNLDSMSPGALLKAGYGAKP
jgi:hypothetical protein